MSTSNSTFCEFIVLISFSLHFTGESDFHCVGLSNFERSPGKAQYMFPIQWAYVLSLATVKWQTDKQINGIVQACSNSSANALELLQSCTKPSKWAMPCPSMFDSCYDETIISQVSMVVGDSLAPAHLQPSWWPRFFNLTLSMYAKLS